MLAATFGCAGGKKSDRSVEEVIRSKRTVDLDRLTDGELRLLLSLVRKEASPCEGTTSLLEELARKKPCTGAVRALGFFYRRILDGYPESDILDHYVARFKAAKEVSIETGGRPDTGPPEAPVVIVVFSDFQCPFCRKAALALKRTKEADPGKVRIVFKHFPLTSAHPGAMEAALAAEAAFSQGRFWEMHESLFALEGKISREKLGEAASRSGLDLDRWEEDLESVEVAERVNRDRSEGMKLKFQGTPAIFVNGVEFEEPVKYLQQYVEEILYERNE